MTHQNQPKSPDSDRLAEIESQLSMTQLRYLIARVEAASDKEAADTIGIKASTVKRWNDDGSKSLIDEAVRLMLHDGIVTAREILRRNLAKAAAVKAAGLDSDNEKIRQDAATEIIDRAGEIGKPTQRNEHTGANGGAIETNTIVEIRGVDYRTVAAKLAPRSVPYSDAPGEDENSFNG